MKNAPTETMGAFLLFVDIDSRRKTMITKYLINVYTYKDVESGLEMEISARTKEAADRIIEIHNKESRFRWVFDEKQRVRREGSILSPKEVEEAEFSNAWNKYQYRKAHKA